MHPAALLPHNAAEARRPSRLTAGTTGAAVFAVCLAYAGWSLLAGRSEDAPPPEAGVALGGGSTPAPAPLVPPSEAPPSARLTLDEGVGLDPTDVTNAYLEVSTDPSSPSDIEPAVRRLGFEPATPAARPAGAVGAWLSGSIEPAAPRNAPAH